MLLLAEGGGGGAAIARHCHIQYREGLTDFERGARFAASALRATGLLGQLARQPDAEFDCAVQGDGWWRSRGEAAPVLDDATRDTMEERSDWKGVLSAPLPTPDADALPNSSGTARP